MGVKDLWTVLSPVKDPQPLSSLSGKTLAVDLSGWVCQAHGIPSAKPHLRQLFVRVFRLYREGVKLVFVLDGKATQLKWDTMDTRARSTGRGGFHGYQRMTGHRSSLNMLIKECTELLDVLGVPYLQSVGEAEALCALLNKEGYVDGVFTQDGDAFLYGATVVYKDLSITEFTVDCYTASRVERELGLTRTDLVSLALLVGCDYCPKGIPHVGRAAALNFIASCKPRDSLEVMKAWVGSSEGSECKVQRLSRGVDGFPSQAVIEEFMTPRDNLPPRDQLSWKMPLVLKIQLFCKNELKWSTENTCAKARLLLTHWVISRKGCGQETKERGGASCSLHPTCIVKNRREKKVACFEVQWSATYKLAGNASARAADSSTVQFTTVENAQLFRRAYSDLCERYEQAKVEKKNVKRKTRLKGTKNKQCSQESPSKLSQSSLDDFLSPENAQSSTALSSETESIQLSDSEPAHSTSPHLSTACSTSPHVLLTHSTSPHSSPAHCKPPSAHSTSPHSSPTHTRFPLPTHSIPSQSPSELCELLPPLKLDTHPVTPSPSPHKSSSATLDRPFEAQEPSKKRGSPHKDDLEVSSPVIVSISDEEEPLPLLVRLGKSPPRNKSSTASSSPLKQVRLDSYFPQKKSRPQKVKRALNLGSKTEPILID